MLYSRFLLVISFICNSVYMLIPNSKFVPPLNFVFYEFTVSIKFEKNSAVVFFKYLFLSSSLFYSLGTAITCILD